MDSSADKPGPTDGHPLRAALLFVKRAGLVSVMGGLASLAAIGRFGPVPADPAGWQQLRGVMRAVFLPCVLAALMLTVLTGIVLWLLSPRRFLRQRWFRVKLLVLAIALPSLHLWARGRVLAFYAAIDASELQRLQGHLERVTQAYAVALIVVAAASVFAWIKPRLGG